MNLTQLKQHIQASPAFIVDLDQVLANLQSLQALREASGCQILYSMKALPLAAVLVQLQGRVDGISVSSLFEARLAKEVLGEQAKLYLTTPGLRADEFAELGRLCTHISFNSLTQFQRLHSSAQGYSKGLRINPKSSFVDDIRYDPCRRHSKLGVDITLLQEGLPAEIEGLHFHTVFSRQDFTPLLQIIDAIEPLLQRARQLRWLNLGGGYLYNAIEDVQPLVDAIKDVRRRFALQVLVEPGKAIVGNAGYLLTTVLDSFSSDGKHVLVLDTSVNHHPEVFEYQIKPPLWEEDLSGHYSALLVGSTCLAGDLFGEYRFAQLPQVGDQLVFNQVGAYSLIKANRFNGYNLPEIHIWQAGRLIAHKRYGFADYRNQWLGA